MYCSCDVAGTGNVRWMLIVAVVKTDCNHTAVCNVFGILKKCSPQLSLKEADKWRGGCSTGTDTMTEEDNGENYTWLQLQQGHRAKSTTLGSNCHKAAVGHSNMTSKTGRDTRDSFYRVEKEWSVTRDTIILQYQEMQGTCQLMNKIK